MPRRATHLILSVVVAAIVPVVAFSLPDASRVSLLIAFEPAVARVAAYIELFPMLFLLASPWLLLEAFVVYATAFSQRRRRIALRCFPIAVGFAPLYPEGCTFGDCDSASSAYFWLLVTPKSASSALSSIGATWGALFIIGSLFSRTEE